MKIKLLLLSLIASSFCIAQDISKKKIEKWTEDYSAKAVENLSDFLSIPNNGLDPIQIQNNLNWSKSTFEDLGFTVTEIISQGIPVLLAEKKLAPNLPTVLFYLHPDHLPRAGCVLEYRPHTRLLRSSTAGGAQTLGSPGQQCKQG